MNNGDLEVGYYQAALPPLYHVYGGDSGGSPENLTDSDRAPGRAERGGRSGEEGSEPQLKTFSFDSEHTRCINRVGGIGGRGGREHFLDILRGVSSLQRGQ